MPKTGESEGITTDSQDAKSNPAESGATLNKAFMAYPVGKDCW